MKHKFIEKPCHTCGKLFQPDNPKRYFCSLECAFWSKVEKKSSQECWPWIGAKNKTGLAYGRFGRNHIIYKAAQVSWKIHFGPIPKGYGYHGICVCHSCDNPSCVNPHHLFLGTQGDNFRDMMKKNRRKKDYRGENNPAHRLTLEKVKEIRNLLIKEIPYRQIAKRYGVGGTTILHIKHGHTWK